MNKEEVLKQYKKEEDRLLIAKVLDKWEMAQTRNKITNSDFLDGYQKQLVQKLINRMQMENTLFFGGYAEAERCVVIFYPDKLEQSMVEKNYNTILTVMELILPKEMQDQYTHRDYLGGLMKLGIKREKIGDIIVFKEGAHILVLPEIVKYLEQNLTELTRFSKAKIEIKRIEELHTVESSIQELQITVSSMRVDNIISELARTSRAKAEELIVQGRVFVNYEVVEKSSKLIKEHDKITIRGKGRFRLSQIIGQSKKGKYMIKVEYDK